MEEVLASFADRFQNGPFLSVDPRRSEQGNWCGRQENASCHAGGMLFVLVFRGLFIIPNHGG